MQIPTPINMSIIIAPVISFCLFGMAGVTGSTGMAVVTSSTGMAVVTSSTGMAGVTSSTGMAVVTGNTGMAGVTGSTGMAGVFETLLVFFQTQQMFIQGFHGVLLLLRFSF